MSTGDSDGRHRPAGPQVHGDSAQGGRAAGAGAGDIATVTHDIAACTYTLTIGSRSYTITEQALANAGPGGVSSMGFFGTLASRHGRRRSRARFAAARDIEAQALSDQLGGGSGYADRAAQQLRAQLPAAGPIAHAPPIEDAGIKVGEIIGWRVWLDNSGRLYSMVANCCWPFDEPLEARANIEPGEWIERLKVGQCFGEGIHAFKTRELAEAYAAGKTIAVVGQVVLWGEVIEFEHGYHAEFARVHSLAAYCGKLAGLARLAELRTLYGVTETE